MKRQLYDVHLTSGTATIDWTCCCICGDGGDLRSTSDGIQSLAAQLVAYWKNNVLDFDPGKITSEFVVGDDGQQYPDFKGAMEANNAVYHHNCYIKYRPYKMEKKIKTMQSKRSKTQQDRKSGPSLRSSLGSPSASSSLLPVDPMCVICGEHDIIDHLHAAGALHATKSKLNVDHVTKLTNQWRNMALCIGDHALLSRLMIGDLGANSSFYHKNCLNKLHNRYRKKKNEQSKKYDVDQIKEAAWDKVIAYINENYSANSENGFEIHELEAMYLEYLSNYEICITSHITRFIDELASRAPNFEIRKTMDTRVFRTDSLDHLLSVFLQSSRNWIESIRSIVQPIREDIFKQSNSFSGNLMDKNQDEYISPFLLALTSMLIDGEVNVEGKCSQAALTTAELVTFNVRKLKSARKGSLTARHHKKERESPVPLYIGLKLYSTVRSRSLIQHLFELGVCVSYDRILSITKSIYENLRHNYDLHGIFLPTSVKKGCFVVLVKDNIDKNATANLIQSHYHGTSLSLLQFSEYENQGENLVNSNFIDGTHNNKKLAPLPTEYTDPKNVHRCSAEFFAPLCMYNFEDLGEFPALDFAKTEEFKWLHQFTASTTDSLSWAQFHIKEDHVAPIPMESTNSLLPLLRDKVNTLEMQCHIMTLNIKAVDALNPGQTPVDVSDCPVYALTKEAQYRFPDQYSNYFAMFGGLHIEQCLLVIHGQLIQNSGLKEILESCSLATIGAGAVVDVNQIKRARYCLQVTVCALHRKLVDAIQKECSILEPSQWLQEKSVSNGMCFYWSLVLNLQVEILVFVRSIREGNFILYVQSLRNLLKCFFAMDHFNYARWLTVHVFDLMSLQRRYPEVYHQMLNGFFSFAKTNNPFSRIALDQVHEQNNKVIKGQGGASSVLNLQNDSALIRWETCGPEVAQIVSQFEELLKDESEMSSDSTAFKHHEDNEQFRAKFSKDVDSVYKSLPCNPFEMPLCTLNNLQQFPHSVFDDLRKVLPAGEEQAKIFINDRLIMQKVPITQKISKNCFPLLKAETSESKLTSFGVPMMNKLRSAVEHRPTQAEVFFAEEPCGVPQCFSIEGTDDMYHGTKSSIKDRLQPCQPPAPTQENYKAVIIEASPVFRKLSEAAVEIFYEFAVVVYNHVTRLAQGFSRLDVIFDRYFESSLKAQTRKGRGSGGTRLPEINDNVPFPENFMRTFLTDTKNKNDLGLYLALKLESIHKDVGADKLQLVATYRDSVVSFPPLINRSEFSVESTSEEADQKIVRHTLHCIEESYINIEIQSIDYDVLILLLAYVAMQMESDKDFKANVFFKLVTPNPVWYNVIVLIKHLGTSICKAFPYFYAFTGCDQVSSFHGKGKCTFFDAWMKNTMKHEMTNVFIRLGNLPDSITNHDMQILEALVKAVYFANVKKHEKVSLDVLRKQQFIQSPSNYLRKLAPSSSALYMHSLRAALVAGFEWRECLHNVVMPDPTEHGYVKKQDIFCPKWLRNPPKLVLSSFLQTCKCKTAVCKSCKCAKLNIPCLIMCHCNRQCK